MSDIFVLVAAVFIIILILCLVAVKQQQEFNERFPPISDAEFVARCTPGSNPGIALRVRRIVADNLGVDYHRIYPSTRFVDDLGAD